MADPMQVEVVAADRVVWSGTSSNIIAKTVEGEIGILPGHAPLLAVLEPSAVVIFCDDGRAPPKGHPAVSATLQGPAPSLRSVGEGWSSFSSS